MSDVIQHLYEYRSLVGRRDALHMRLGEHDRSLLDALERLFAPRLARGSMGTERRRYLRAEVNILAAVRAGGKELPAQIVDLGGGGCELRAALASGIGNQILIKVSGDGRIYHFPARITWKDGGRLGCAFVGVPVEIRMGPGFGPLARAA